VRCGPLAGHAARGELEVFFPALGSGFTHDPNIVGTSSKKVTRSADAAGVTFSPRNDDRSSISATSAASPPTDPSVTHLPWRFS